MVSEAREDDMNKLDKSIHNLYEAHIANNIQWRNFQDIQIDEPYFAYYYAEDNLYVIRDIMTEQYWLVRATSPGEALRKFKIRLYQIIQAGQEKSYDI